MSIDSIFPDKFRVRYFETHHNHTFTNFKRNTSHLCLCRYSDPRPSKYESGILKIILESSGYKTLVRNVRVYVQKYYHGFGAGISDYEYYCRL